MALLLTLVVAAQILSAALHAAERFPAA